MKKLALGIFAALVLTVAGCGTTKNEQNSTPQKNETGNGADVNSTADDKGANAVTDGVDDAKDAVDDVIDGAENAGKDIVDGVDDVTDGTNSSSTTDKTNGNGTETK